MENVFFLMFGPQEWIIILIIVLLLFGGSKIPQLMKGLGQGVKEFNNAKKGIDEETKQ
ncbi:MAG: twin-arginine translocase TatA/TatE family subunit [Saprospiraceae bacterium]|jgi:sec-independent protein translocase protein TatA|nr:twin-arginine translocase TatA/TatE family subunit [Saprospiraceae bacterium]MBL0293637.1 twin-arginine translocase TatA/TatE family subunit [Saprospiraceae bacterium]